MLGYVKIEKSELKVREYEVYCGYYCGICKSIGARYGQLPRMVLSYDAAFLALTLASLDDTPDAPSQEHCIVHHINKKTVIRNRAVDYAADVMLILAWYKMLDDVSDEGKTSARAASLVFRRTHRKLLSAYPELCSVIEDRLSELSALEKDRCPSLDAAAEAFSMIMEALFVYGIRALYGDDSYCDWRLEPEDAELTPAQLLAKLGYHMGKWIYLTDAADDIEENIESGAYNPLLFRFERRDDESPSAFRQRIQEPLSFNLYHYLAMAAKCANLLDIKKNKGIIENVIYLGMNRKTEEIISMNQKGETDEPI